MDLKIKDIRFILNSKLFSVSLPVSLSYKLARFTKTISEELMLVDQERLKIVTKHGGVINQGDNFYSFPTAEAAQTADREIAELFENVIEVQFTPIPLSALESVSLSAEDISLVLPLLECDQ